MGSHIGMIIENRLAIGQLVIRITTDSNAGILFKQLKSAGYGVTQMNGESSAGAVLAEPRLPNITTGAGSKWTESASDRLLFAALERPRYLSPTLNFRLTGSPEQKLIRRG